MHVHEQAATAITIRTRTAHANAWLRSWNDAAAHILLAVIEQNRITVRETATATRLLSITWGGSTVVVSEIQAQSAIYQFDNMPTAIVFLNALLTRLVADLTEPRPVSNFPFTPVFGAV